MVDRTREPHQHPQRDGRIAHNGDCVVDVGACDLQQVDGDWSFASEHAVAIDRHWDAARRERPSYFNGTVLVMSRLSIADDALDAQLIAVEFKSVLYWRSLGFPDAGVIDGFGSALLRASDDAIILTRQAAGHLNGGETYLPGGFIDLNDCDDHGCIDIAASVARELAEETGLAPPDVSPEGTRFLITLTGPHASIAVAYRSSWPADETIAAVRRHIAREAAPELDDAVAVRGRDDLARLRLPRYADCLLTTLLPSGDGSQPVGQAK